MFTPAPSPKGRRVRARHGTDLHERSSPDPVMNALSERGKRELSFGIFAGAPDGRGGEDESESSFCSLRRWAVYRSRVPGTSMRPRWFGDVSLPLRTAGSGHDPRIRGGVSDCPPKSCELQSA